jgi:ABC-type sugar transport system permease subunit
MKKSQIAPYLFVFPAIAMLLVFQFYPIFGALRISLLDWSGMGKGTFVGLQNYRSIFHDQLFWHSISLTFIWVILSTTLLSLGSLILAVLVEYSSRTKWMAGFTRTIFFMPMMMSLVSVGLLWSLIYNPTVGLLNAFLSKIGAIDPMNPLNILGNRKTALYGAFVPAIWQWSGFGMVVLSAAMTNISQEMLEAAAVDGAGRARQFFSIVLPLLIPTIFTISVINMIGAFKAFDLVYVMTAGGPGDATLVTSLYLFRTAFVLHKFGYASAIAAVLFFLVLIFTLFFNNLNSKVSEYFGE